MVPPEPSTPEMRGTRQELALQRVILQALQIVQRVNRPAEDVVRVRERVAQDFAGGRGRGNLRRHAGRELSQLQAVDDFLLGLIEVLRVIELVAQMGKAK